jgi:hypothetical protein
MAYEVKPNTGSLFKNTYKKTGDNKPDMKGDVVLDKTFIINMMDQSKGSTVTISLAAWVKESEKVGKFMSINVSEPFVKQATTDPWE